MQMFNYFVVTVLNVFNIYNLNKNILDAKMKASRRLFFGVILLEVILLWLVNMIVRQSLFKFIIIFLFMIVLNMSLFNEKLIKSTITALLTYIIFMLSEIICVIFIIIIFGNEIISNLMISEINVCLNVCIVIVSTCLISNDYIKINLNNIINKLTFRIDKSFLASVFFMFISFSILLLTSFYQYTQNTLLWLNLTLIIMYFLVTYILFKEKSNSMKQQEKFEHSMYELRQIENMLHTQRELNHNTKNDFISIKGMVGKSENKDVIIDYINELIDDRIEDDEGLINSVVNIPYGGVQAIIYKKLLDAKNKDLNYSLIVGKNVETVKDLGLKPNQLKNLCTILGIYLDNANEAAFESKEKEVLVEIVLKKCCLIIKIANTFNSVEAAKIDEQSYSSKGKNRGYGLKIAKQLLENCKVVTSERKINSNVFTQTIMIKTK